ncbi:hypothetical protein GPALN_001799 [Globodera pallida]|nr:hypothetical protein GPALN_001799 [Globodera pallida]
MISRCGNKAGHLSLLHNFVRELWEFKLEGQKEARQQRGEGIGIKTPTVWRASDNSGSKGACCGNYCLPKASLPANSHNKQLASVKTPTQQMVKPANAVPRVFESNKKFIDESHWRLFLKPVATMHKRNIKLFAPEEAEMTEKERLKRSINFC